MVHEKNYNIAAVYLGALFFLFLFGYGMYDKNYGTVEKTERTFVEHKLIKINYTPASKDERSFFTILLKDDNGGHKSFSMYSEYITLFEESDKNIYRQNMFLTHSIDHEGDTVETELRYISSWDSPEHEIHLKSLELIDTLKVNDND